MRRIFLFLMTLCLLFVANGSWAQRNVYVNETVNGYNRVRIVRGIEKVDFANDSVRVWSDSLTAHSFATSTVGMMSFREKDPWRAMTIPEQYHADFDFDINFEEADKERVQQEAEETDETSVQYDDFVTHSTWTKTVFIDYDEADVTVTGDIDSLTITQECAHLTIETVATGVKYIISGTSSDAFFKLYSERKACIVLNGVDLTNPYGPVINSQLKRRLFIDLPANTVNTLTDGEAYIKVKGEDQRGCIFAEGKICISGEGQLYVTGNKKCGIASDKYIHFMGGFVHVVAHAEKGKAVYGQENVIIGGGVLRTYSDAGAGKGITSDSLIWIRGGLIKAITIGDAIWDETEEDYSSSCGIKSMWDMDISGGEIHCLSTGVGGKGISAGNLAIVNDKKKYNGNLTIANADIYVRTTGKRIPEEKEEDGHGHKVGASSSPKCIKCINKLFINSGSIYVRGSGGGAAEGLEAKKQCEINGGKIRSYCADDALNCSGCTMNDGDVVIISSENDGLDAGNLKLFGGTIYAVGGWDAQMGIDTDGKTFEITGGEIIGVAARSCTPHGTSTQAAICFYLPKTYCSAAALADADGNIITQFPTPNTYEVLCMLVTNDRIKEGDSYKIFSYKDSIDDEPVTEYEFTMEGLFMTLGSKKSKETK